MRRDTHTAEPRRDENLLVSKRRRLLDYLKKTDSDRYRDVIAKLGIRK